MCGQETPTPHLLSTNSSVLAQGMGAFWRSRRDYPCFRLIRHHVISSVSPCPANREVLGWCVVGLRVHLCSHKSTETHQCYHERTSCGHHAAAHALMALKWTRLKILLCASAFFCLLLLWCQLPWSVTEGNWSLVLGSSSFYKNGVKFSLLFSTDLQEPKCQNHLVLMVLVSSDPGHREARKSIRRTWAASAQGSVHPWQVVFLIGQTLDLELDWHIHKEQAAHGDILMGNYLDSYRNLTLKVMHGMKWASERCQPLYILKTDDDCFVNIDRLPAFLAHHNKVPAGLYVGSVFSKEKRVVIRDPTSKWYVSKENFLLDSYPPYASGIGYVLSLDVVRKILRLAEIIPPLPVEDAYIGFLAWTAQIKLLSSSRFTKYNIKWGICNYRYLMVIHRLAPSDQELALKNGLRARNECADNAEVAHW